MTLDQRKELATACRARGLNCAQSVALAFTDLFPEPERDARALERALAGMGAGFGDTSQICGAASGAVAAMGLITYRGIEGKAQAMDDTRSLVASFAAEAGATRCHDLKKMCHKPCNELVLTAVEILHKKLCCSNLPE